MANDRYNRAFEKVASTPDLTPRPRKVFAQERLGKHDHGRQTHCALAEIASFRANAGFQAPAPTEASAATHRATGRPQRPKHADRRWLAAFPDHRRFRHQPQFRGMEWRRGRTFPRHPAESW